MSADARAGAPPVRPTLDQIVLGDAPEAWRRLGFTVDVDDRIALGGVRLQLGADGEGMVGWSFRDLANRDLDGLGACPSDAPPPEPVAHPLGAVAVDHVVVVTPDFDRTVGKFRDAGLDFRRTREAGAIRQAFFVLGPCLLEVGGPVDGDEVRFWGLTLVVDDLDGAYARLGDRCGAPRDAVQPGRRIATLRAEAGLGLPVALMSPRS